MTTAGTFAMRPHMERFYDAGGTPEQDKQGAYQEGRRRDARLRVLAHYGISCACCGTTERLTIDHINGDGAQHRKEIGDGGRTLTDWLIKNNFPPGFQTLCASCNLSKSDGERCRLHDSRRITLISKTVRIPNDLLAWLTAHAAANGMSIHDSLVTALEDFKAAHPDESEDVRTSR